MNDSAFELCRPVVVRLQYDCLACRPGTCSLWHLLRILNVAWSDLNYAYRNVHAKAGQAECSDLHHPSTGRDLSYQTMCAGFGTAFPVLVNFGELRTSFNKVSSRLSCKSVGGDKWASEKILFSRYDIIILGKMLFSRYDIIILGIIAHAIQQTFTKGLWCWISALCWICRKQT
jgi:hypothetical protein